MIEDTIKSDSMEKIDSSVKVNGIGRISVLSEDKGLVQEKLVVEVKQLVRKMPKRVDNTLVALRRLRRDYKIIRIEGVFCKERVGIKSSRYVYCDNRRSNSSTDVP